VEILAQRLLTDSAAGDSAAWRSLPARLRRDLDLGPLLTERALRDSARAYCQPLADDTAMDVRKRLRGRWPDSLAVILFVRASRASGALKRVELVRRTTDGGQRGYIWAADGDQTQGAEWPRGSPRPETRTLPAGTPTPRALRGLGRRLLVLPCTGTPPSR
jgi:hypothetical protein